MGKKISELPVASSVGPTDLVPIVQAGVTKQATKSQITPMPYIFVAEEYAGGNDGGTNTTGWQTRVLNTVKVDSDNLIVSLSGNALTIPAGTYRFRAKAASYSTDRTRMRLYNQTDSSVIATGSSCFTNNYIYAEVTGRFTISAQKAIRVEQYTETQKLLLGLGVAVSDGTSVEQYTTLELWKE